MNARRQAANYDADSMTAGQITLGVAFLVPFAWVTTGFTEVPRGWEWGILVYIALVCTVLPFFLMFWLSKRASATQTSLSNYFVPLFGVTGGALVLGEQLQPGLLIAAPLIIGGALMVDSFETRARATPLSA
jgi:drug/metabolite transporter (DMT)-like permease